MTRGWTGIVCGLAGALLLAACGDRGGAPPTRHEAVAGPAGACAARLVWHGRAYAGVSLARPPQVVRRLGRGVLPPCNDSEGRPVTQRLSVLRIRGVDPRRAVSVGYDPRVLFVAEGADGAPVPLPAALAALTRAPRCTGPGGFHVRAIWIGVVPRRGYSPRFDGDLGPAPYRLELDVVDGPARLRGARITVHTTGETRHPLAPRDVRGVLWRGGTLGLTLGCTRGGTVVRAVDPRAY